MIIRQNKANKRAGVATVEMALVSFMLFLFLFGIFEYCRLLFVLHLAENAAHDAARFAAVHTSGGTMAGEPTSISNADLQNLCKTGQVSGVAYGTGLCGMDKNISGLTVNVFTVDPTALATGTVQQLSGSTWDSASFSQKIAVQITGTYQPVLPSFLFMGTGSGIPFSVTVMFSSEGN
ncbi:MAG: pilus assembly protein [Planctomycetes bacterium]|nr:pilus assembly protein [Planctomycetota bacterium]